MTIERDNVHVLEEIVSGVQIVTYLRYALACNATSVVRRITYLLESLVYRNAANFLYIDIVTQLTYFTDVTVGKELVNVLVKYNHPCENNHRLIALRAVSHPCNHLNRIITRTTYSVSNYIHCRVPEFVRDVSIDKFLYTNHNNIYSSYIVGSITYEQLVTYTEERRREKKGASYDEV